MNKTAAIATTAVAGIILVGGAGVLAASSYAQEETPREQITNAINRASQPAEVTLTNNTWQTVRFVPAGTAVPLTLEPGASLQLDKDAFTQATVAGTVVYPNDALHIKATTPGIGNSILTVGHQQHKIADGKSITLKKSTHSITADRNDDNGVKDLQITIND